MAQVPDGVDPGDWVTIWQSEWAAIAVDREVAEGLAAVALAWHQVVAGRADRSAGLARADAPARAAAADDAPGPEPSRDAEPSRGNA